MSVSKFCHDNNSFFDFYPRPFLVKNHLMKKTLLHDNLENGIYKFRMNFITPRSSSTFLTTASHTPASTTRTEQFTLWHARLGHPVANILKLLKPIILLYVLLVNMEKATNYHFHFLSPIKASNILDLIHTNLWGPSPIPASIGARYFLLFVDDCSRFSRPYPLHTKDQAYLHS